MGSPQEGNERMVEERRTEISTRINRQGAMLDEVRRVLPLLDPSDVRHSLRELVIDQDIFRRSSLASREQLFSNLGIRYFRADTPTANASFVRFASAEPDEGQAGLLAYVMLLWNDGLIYTLGQEWWGPRMRVPGLWFRTDDIVSELDRLAERHPAIRKWNAATRKSVATHYLTMLRDCGLAKGTQKKELLQPYVSPSVVHMATLLLMNAGTAPRRVPEASFFRALGLTTGNVVDALTELDRQGIIDFAVQGDVTHLVLPEVPA